MRKTVKIVLIVALAVIAVLAVVSLVMAGALGGIGPFGFIHTNRLKNAPGNAEEYHLENVTPLSDSPLKGKNILFLGSSVTKGACSLDVSMADYIGKLDSVNITKEAVSGTTLSTAKGNSYVARLLNIDTRQPFDVIVVQLSTNDASQKLTLGSVSESTDINDFDTSTIDGAIEYIIAYCRDHWNCPIVFYTGTKYDSDLYGQMVTDLKSIAAKWNISVIDLWDDPDMNAVSEEDYKLYMFDHIHPTQAGYLLWWTPKFEDTLYQLSE